VSGKQLPLIGLSRAAAPALAGSITRSGTRHWLKEAYVRKISLMLSVALLGIGIAAVPAAAKGPCAKQEAALRKAHTKSAKSKAKKALANCKKAHAPVPPVAVSPANPFVDEGVTIKIHLAAPLSAGQVFKIFVNAFGGHIGDGFSHLVSKETTSTSVEITPREDMLGGNEWADGKGFVIVSTGVPGTEAGDTPLGSAEFRFIKKP
jgi:hypothetical protein